MADTQGADSLRRRHESALEIVQSELQKDATFELVQLKDKEQSPVVWRKRISVAGKDWSVEVALTKRFPDEPPLAKVLDADDLFLRNPHVLKGGFLCAIPDSASLNSKDPVGIIRYICDQAKEILAGTGSDDFKDEFSYYWNRCATEGAQDVLILSSIDNLGASFPVTFRKSHILAASSSEIMDRWTLNFLNEKFELEAEDLGVAIHLASPLLPSNYPNTLEDLMALADANDAIAAKLIKEHVAKSRGRGLALLVQKEGDGIALGGIIFDGLGLSASNSSELIKGFRPGHVPIDILLSRSAQTMQSTKITRSSVKRIDHQRIHSRGGDGRDFSQKRVLLIGCGSLGGYVAHLLSRAGIGHLTITDNDHLGWENLGRHILGASSVGRSKSEALAEKLKEELPHLSIVGIPKDWRDAFDANPNIFKEHDLVVSTVADWRCEGPLNEMARKTQMPPILFGWLEPHAVAGHCLVVASSNGCFECSANEFGQFNYNVANFNKDTISKEPGGCAHYQHYGPTALMPVASLIASTAIESLLNPSRSSFLKTWISSKEHFDTVEAAVNKPWEEKVSKDGFLRTFNMAWDKSGTCFLCNQASH